ncbi:MAG: sigma-70 family RNA polymerase sigma factor [Planctomycetota bacterium]
MSDADSAPSKRGQRVLTGTQQLEAEADRLRLDIVRQMSRLCRDGHEAEDVVQEALLRAFRSLERRRASVELRPWLMQIARRVLYDQVRRRSGFARTDGGESVAGAPARGGEPGEALEGGELSLDGQLVPSIVAERAVREGLASLRERDRALLIDHYERGLSCPEIAARDGALPQTIKVRLFRARGRLAHQVERRVRLATGVDRGQA